MRKHKRGGRLINTASGQARQGFIYTPHYAASKFGVVGITQSLAKEVAKEGITVNAFCPGIIETDMWAYNDEVWGKLLGNLQARRTDGGMGARHSDGPRRDRRGRRGPRDFPRERRRSLHHRPDDQRRRRVDHVLTSRPRDDRLRPRRFARVGKGRTGGAASRAISLFRVEQGIRIPRSGRKRSLFPAKQQNSEFTQTMRSQTLFGALRSSIFSSPKIERSLIEFAVLAGQGKSRVFGPARGARLPRRREDRARHTFGTAIPRLTASRSPTAVSQRFTAGIASISGPRTGPRKVLPACIHG